MAVGNRNDTVTFVLVLCLIFATLASSSGFVRNITQESGSENRSSGSGNWTAVSGGRPVRSDPNTLHHHKTRTENGGCGGGSRAAAPSPRPVRSDTNTFHHHKSRTENGGGSSSSRVAVPTPRPVRSGPNPYQHNRHRTASQP
ncbi:hypothetical protein WN944_009307 [Citrus x changshan-huyou]|uniref:Uncharacterized protein n=1 Tax=Citrus x changshan-huyou TaxID=2935761 RepID=A0AAP0MPI1_9ROSI